MRIRHGYTATPVGTGICALAGDFFPYGGAWI